MALVMTLAVTLATSVSQAQDGDSAQGNEAAGQVPIDVAFELAMPGQWPQVPTGTARAVFAVDATTGQVLAERNADQRVEVASTVKLVTALTARRLYDLDRQVTAGQEATLGGSTANVDPGETWTVRDLLLGLLLRSGNDAAEVLAQADGDRDGFIAEMNTVVEELGVQGAVIVEPHGLDDANLLSARDLAVIAQAVLADDVLAEMVTARHGDLPDTGVVPNRNLLLERMDNAVGVKTGTTDIAGASLVGAATWQDRTVITVVVGAVADEARYDESELLQRWVDTELTAAEVGVGGRLRRPGQWVGRRRSLTLWAPGAVDVDTQVRLDSGTIISRVTSQDSALAQAVVAVPDAQPPTSMGQSVVASAYDALRAAQTAGALHDG